MSKSTSVTGQSNTLLSHFHFDTSAMAGMKWKKNQENKNQENACTPVKFGIAQMSL